MRNAIVVGGALLLSAYGYAQNVGIGTANPASRLHVVGGSQIIENPLNTTSYLILRSGTNNGLIIETSSDGSLTTGRIRPLQGGGAGGGITINQSSYVGIGLTADLPQYQLHVHSTNSNVASGIAFTNSITGSAPDNGMKVGLQYPSSAIDRQGFVSLPAAIPFYIWQGLQPRFIIGNTGSVGIGMKPYDFATLNVKGSGYFFAKGTEGAVVSAVDTGTSPTLSGVGFIAQKRLSTGNNFFSLILRGDRPEAYIDANFKDGTANERTARVLFDSLGNVGIGSYIFDSTLRGKLHVFGDQRIQNNGGAVLTLHGETDNYSNSSSELRLQYTPIPGLRAPSGPLVAFSPQYYFMRLERPSGGATSGDLNIGFTTKLALGDVVDYTALSQNDLSQVGIRRRPDRSLSDSIRVDVEGFTRINGGLVVSSTGASSGSLLVTDGAGIARFRRPATLVVDNTTNGIVSYEFRNNGAYRGALGWDQAAGRFFFFDGESNTNTFFINNGRLGILRDPTTNALEINGNASKASAGDWLANSDARLKKDITPLTGALAKLQQLQGITYQWADDQTGQQRPAGTHMGFTAQNVQQVFPQLVSADAQGFLQTSYGTYDALYVEAIKELLQKIEALEAKLQVLEKKLK